MAVLITCRGPPARVAAVINKFGWIWSEDFFLWLLYGCCNNWFRHPYLQLNWVVVSNIFHFHPYLGKWSNLTNIFRMGWNHQLVNYRYKIYDLFLHIFTYNEQFFELKDTKRFSIPAYGTPNMERKLIGCMAAWNLDTSEVGHTTMEFFLIFPQNVLLSLQNVFVTVCFFLFGTLFIVYLDMSMVLRWILGPFELKPFWIRGESPWNWSNSLDLVGFEASPCRGLNHLPSGSCY